MKRIWEKKFMDSRVCRERVSGREKALGYFLGPCLVAMAYTALSGNYLTQFYTDVLGLTGAVLTWMPLISKALCSVVNFLFGRLMDRTRTAQGKARPWILVSGFLMAVLGVLLYVVPPLSDGARLAWVVISYNLFFALAYSIYSMSHSLMVPLSTREVKARDSLAMLTSTGASMIPGALVTVVMPLLVNRIGVGAGAQGAWLTVMGLLSVIAIPGALMEYYFTLERVTEDAAGAETVSALGQLKACLTDRSWLSPPSPWCT